MHVDGNGHGSSYIIALGKFTRGQLWVYTRAAANDTELEVPCKMTDRPSSESGIKVKEKPHDVKNQRLTLTARCHSPPRPATTPCTPSSFSPKAADKSGPLRPGSAYSFLPPLV